MQNFDKVSIQDMSKDDILLIIQALEYTGNNTDIKEFIQLRNSFIKELSYLTEIPESKFIDFLQKETQSILD